MKIIIQNASKEFVDGLIKKHPGKINIVKQNIRAYDNRKEKRQDKIINVLYGLGKEAVKRTFPIINNIDLKRMKLSQTRENHIILKY